MSANLTVSREKQAEILNDHYNETYNAVEIVWSQRNRVALYIYLLSVALLVPNMQELMIKHYVENTPVTISVPMLYLIGLIGLLAMCTLLTQRTNYLNRQYVYLDGLEARIQTLIGHPLIAREGIFYHARNINAKERVTLPIPYHWLYEAVLGLLMAGVLINSFYKVIQSNNEHTMIYILAYLLIAAAFLYVLISFFRRKKSIKNADIKINENLMVSLNTYLSNINGDDIMDEDFVLVFQDQRYVGYGRLKFDAEAKDLKDRLKDYLKSQTP